MWSIFHFSFLGNPDGLTFFPLNKSYIHTACLHSLFAYFRQERCFFRNDDQEQLHLQWSQIPTHSFLVPASVHHTAPKKNVLFCALNSDVLVFAGHKFHFSYVRFHGIIYALALQFQVSLELFLQVFAHQVVFRISCLYLSIPDTNILCPRQNMFLYLICRIVMKACLITRGASRQWMSSVIYIWYLTQSMCYLCPPQGGRWNESAETAINVLFEWQ